MRVQFDRMPRLSSGKQPRHDGVVWRSLARRRAPPPPMSLGYVQAWIVPPFNLSAAWGRAMKARKILISAPLLCFGKSTCGSLQLYVLLLLGNIMTVNVSISICKRSLCFWTQWYIVQQCVRVVVRYSRWPGKLAATENSSILCPFVWARGGKLSRVVESYVGA